MTVNLQKGQKISLSKDNSGLGQVMIGLGWDEVEQARGLFKPKPQAIDCDASAILLKNGKLFGMEDLVYYNNLKHKTGTVKHMGDNLTGAGDGDDEQIVVDLSKIPTEYDKVVVVVNIYEAFKRKQHFGLIKNAFCRLVDSRNNKEICNYNLTENYSNMTCLIVGEIYRYNNEWKFNAIGQATTDDGLSKLVERFK